MAGGSSMIIIILVVVAMIGCASAGAAYYEGWTCSMGFGNSCSSSSSTPSSPGPSTLGGAGSSGSTGSTSPSGPPVPNKQHLKNGNGTCAISDGTMGVGSAIYNYTCPPTGTGTVNEQWVYTPVGQLLDYQSTFPRGDGTTTQMCANIPNANPATGAIVSLYPCAADTSDHTSNDQWDFSSDGRIHARMAPNMCMDSGTGVAPTPITLQPCSTAQSQVFSVVP